MERTAFRAMGTEVELLLDVESTEASENAFADARAEFVRLEALLSRFRPDSELSALNRSGRLRRPSPDLLRLTELALAARERTGGRFDPTVHDALVAAGYDRSFDEIGSGGTVVATEPQVACGGAVSVTEAGGIQLYAGVRLDFGGIGKGYAVDRVSDVLSAYGPCLASAGGDLAVRGGVWPIGVETGNGQLTLELASGAIATSGSDRRHWTTTEGSAHHLIDPSTGRPAKTDLLRVTVVGRTAVEAEVLATALYLAGAESATREAEELGVPAVLVLCDGSHVLVGGLA
jgi:thiamine biosynthesis lipoprotein